MLQSIHLKDFKSFADEEVALAPLTVLVGANASGKSNLLDAIRFVQGVGLDFTVIETLQGRWEAGREVWKGLRGGLAEAVRHGQPSARITTTWRLDERSWRHEVGFTSQPKPRLLTESFRSPELDKGEFVALYQEALPSEHTELPVPEGAEQFRHVVNRFVDQSFLRRLSYSSPDSPFSVRFSAPGIQAAGEVLSILSQSLFLTLSTEHMRTYSPKRTGLLGAQGEFLSSTLWALCQDTGTRQEWVDWLSELLSPELTGIDFIETELGDVMLALIEADGTRTSARSLSDGTLRFLGTLVALRTAPPGSFVLMEEPETGLHPQRIHLLVEYLEAVTKERGIQVIATTHSPQFLQALSPQGLRDTVLCARVPDRSGTVLRRLGDLPHFDEVSTRSSIDHLFTTGWLERAL